MGLFSKIKDVFKKVVRKVGKVIKKVTKPFVKVFQKVMKPIGKIFNKLGFVGTLALGFMFGGGFPWLKQWFSGLGEGGTFLGEFMGKVSEGFGKIMKPFKSTFKSVTEMFKQGINRVGQAFGVEAPGAMTWDTSGEFGFLKAGGSAEGAGRTVTEALGDFLQNTLNKVTGKPKVFKGVEVAPVPTVPAPAATMTENILDPEWTSPTGEPLSMGMDPINPEILTADAGTGTGTGSEQTWLGDKIDALGDVKDSVAKVQLGNVATLGEVGTAGKTALKGYTVYSQFAPSDYETPFYNDNISTANAMMTQVDQDSASLSGLQFSEMPVRATDSFNTLAQNYLTGFGYAPPTGQSDIYNYAMQMPGYGYTFENYLYDNVNDYLS